MLNLLPQKIVLEFTNHCQYRRDFYYFSKAKVDIIVVLMHFGQELHRLPLPYQLHISKHLMSLGVQVIIGAHPHVLQPHCFHDNKLIAYSLGNFLFYPKQPLGASVTYCWFSCDGIKIQKR